MGGRGALINFKSNFGKPSIDMDDTFNEDNKTKKNNPTIQKLNKMNVVVMSSTDNIKSEILDPNLEKIHQVLSSNDVFFKYLEKEPLYIRTEKIRSQGVQAVFRNGGMRLQRPEIIFNINLTQKTKLDIEKTAQRAINAKHWTNSDKDELVNRVMVHELGHYVQSVLIEEKYKGLRSDIKYNKIHEAELMYNDINEICLKKFKKPAETSVYGTTSEGEFFAETFAEFFTTKKPSYTACALGMYLKEKLK